MTKIAVVTVGLLLLAAGGCTAEIGTERGAGVASVDGLANAYVSLHDLPPYDGVIVRLGILDGGERPGEIASVDVWPLAGAAIGIIGARVRILMLGAGVGILWYSPEPLARPAPPPDDA